MINNRLGALDAGFLEVEDGDGHISMAVGALAVLTGPMPEFTTIMSTLDIRSERLPHCRDILHTSPFDLFSPQWTPVQEFNIERHVRRTAVSQPGDRSALYRAAADLMQRRLHRSRPLWEVWVIDGLVDGQWAMLIKVHHCLADAVTATEMLTQICDNQPSRIGTSAGERTVSATSKSSGLQPFFMTRKLVTASESLVRTTARVAVGAKKIIAGVIAPAPESLTIKLTDLRRFGSAAFPVADIQRICQQFAVTLNDVILTATTDAFRSAMLRQGVVPRAGSVRTLVPVSDRPTDSFHEAGNRVSIMLSSLPVDREDPIDQLRTINRRMTNTKQGGQRQSGSLIVSIGNFIPYPVKATTVRLMSRLPPIGIVTLATNIRGPKSVMQFMGTSIEELIPIPAIALGLQASIAVISYADTLTFGVLGDFDAQIDVDQLTCDIESGMKRLLAIADATARSRRLGNLLLLTSLSG